MEGLKRINKSIDYLEDNLCNDIKIENVAVVAGVSKYHFQRMFHLVTGVTVAEYLRQRRLTLAAHDLLDPNCKVIDVALKYSYSTPESFSKSFKKLHGVSPSTVQDKEIILEAYPRIFFQIQVRGAEKMKYKIIEKDSFSILGKVIKASIDMQDNFNQIPEFWQECEERGLVKELYKLRGNLGILGVCMDINYEQEELTYLAAVEKNGEKLSRDFDLVERKIPSSTWAVFEVEGEMPDSIQQIWQQIFTEWFPSTGYEYASKPDLEAYYVDDFSTYNDCRAEIWISIKEERKSD